MDDGVGTGHYLPCAVEARLVKRVCQCLDHPSGSIMRQLRVAVQGNYKPYVGKPFRISHVNQALGVARACPHYQVIELFQLSPFAFPPDECLLGFTPFPLPVQQEKTLSAVAPIKGFDALLRGLQQDRVRFAMLLPGIGIIRVKGKEEVVLFIGKIADLDLFRLGLDLILGHQHHRHDDQRPAAIGNTRDPEIHLRQSARR